MSQPYGIKRCRTSQNHFIFDTNLNLSFQRNYRYAAYRNLFFFLFKKNEKKKDYRQALPSCLVVRVRKAFPEDSDDLYVGYKKKHYNQPSRYQPLPIKDSSPQTDQDQPEETQPKFGLYQPLVGHLQPQTDHQQPSHPQTSRHQTLPNSGARTKEFPQNNPISMIPIIPIIQPLSDSVPRAHALFPLPGYYSPVYQDTDQHQPASRVASSQTVSPNLTGHIDICTPQKQL